MVRLGRVMPLWAVILLLAALTEAAQAQDKAPVRPRAAQPDERSARVDEALRLSHLKAYLATIRARLLGYLDPEQTNSEIRQRIAGSLKTAYSPEAYLSAIKLALLDSFDAEALTRVTAWYRSPAGRKLVRSDEAAQEVGQAAARRTYFAALEDKQPSDYRLVLIFSIDEASHDSAGMVSALKASIEGWKLGIERLGGERERSEIPHIEAALRKNGAEPPDDVADDVLRERMYTYRDATDADLRRYAEFLESDAGKWFIGTAFKAHGAYFDKVVDQIAEDLVNTVTRNQAPRPSPPSAKPLQRGAPTPPTTAPSLPARK